MVSKGDLSNYLFCVVVWSVLVNDEFWVQLEKSTPLPSPAVGEVLKPVELQLEVMDQQQDLSTVFLYIFYHISFNSVMLLWEYW